MNSLQISAWIMLMFTAMWAGGILMYRVDRVEVWKRMTVLEYAVDFRRSLFQVDPMMPIFNIIAALATIYFALHQSGDPKFYAWLGLAGQIAVVGGSVTLGEPVNSKFRRLPEGQPPERAEHWRVYWRRFHTVRTIVAVSTMGVVALAVIMARP